MNLKKIKITPSEELSERDTMYLRSILDEFALSGEANYETELEAGIFNLGNEIIGERITLSPKSLEKNLRISLGFGNLPAKYQKEYVFGGGNVCPFLVISELSEDIRFPVKRRFYVYCSPLKEND